MQLTAATRGRRPLQLELSFEDFLASGHMRRQATVAMCSPEDLIYDHLPPFDGGDTEEIREAFAEACEQASDCALTRISLDEHDLAFVRGHFLGNRNLRLLWDEPLTAA